MYSNELKRASQVLNIWKKMLDLYVPFINLDDLKIFYLMIYQGSPETLFKVTFTVERYIPKEYQLLIDQYFGMLQVSLSICMVMHKKILVKTEMTMR